MAGSYEGVLASIPGLAGVLASRQARDQQQAQALQQTTGVLGLMSQIQSQQHQAELQPLQLDMLRAQLEQAKAKPTLGQPIGAGGLRLPDGTIVAPQARPVADRPAPIGSGGLRLPDGTIVPPVQKPVQQPTSVLSRLISERDALPENDPRRTAYDNAIRKQSETPKQINPQIVMPKVPMGYRETGDGNLEAIPGGPADTKIQGVLNQDTQALNDSVNNMDRLATVANKLKSHPGLSGITGIRGKIPTIPGTDAANAQAELETLKSQVGFGVLQNMRNNSKTGGALGQISDKEEKLLQDNLAALSQSQSTEEFQKNLQNVIDYTESAKDRLRSAYNMKHGDAVQTRPTQKPQNGRQPVRISGDAEYNALPAGVLYIGPDGIKRTK